MNIFPFLEQIKQEVEQNEIEKARVTSLILADYLEEYGDIRATKLRQLDKWNHFNSVLMILGELCDCANPAIIRLIDHTKLAVYKGLLENNIDYQDALYLNSDGKITKHPSELGYSQLIGYAINPEYIQSQCPICNDYGYIIKNEVINELI